MASDKNKLIIHTSQIQEVENKPKAPSKTHFTHKKAHSTVQDRLLRNSCLACAILLGILALGNLQQPWAQNASASIEKALTMEIDLDKSLGQLSFVKKLMPESALVFFNLNGDNDFIQPVQGKVTHSYSETQPWLMFSSAENASVCACADGTIAAVSPMSSGGYGVLIDHGNGVESVTACMSEVHVQTGNSVVKGSIIGSTAGTLYFELRENETSTDPTERMGL